jgi:TetR/AcrR family transcriptional repressor of nem operon
MGRRKTYDRDELIERSMEMFRNHGYAGTSTQLLVDGLGVNRYSLYAEFGDKQSLFDAALERYFDEVIEPRFGPLEAPDADIGDISAVFEFYASQADGAASGRGCLLCNTAIELGSRDPSGAGFVHRYINRLSTAFRAALANAHDKGQLASGVDPREEAEFFTASVLGLFVLLRAAAPPATVEHAARAAIRHLDSLGDG